MTNMKIRTVKKVIKEFLIKGRYTPLAHKVTLKRNYDFMNNKDHKNSKAKSRRIHS